MSHSECHVGTPHAEALRTMPGPHDLFARFTFDDPERAGAELRAVLPPAIVEQVDWSSLRREPVSVVDPELRESQSDLLFSAQLHGGQPLLLYFLLEHQSTVDRWMALRMLRYVVRQLERWRQQNPAAEQLPIILPVVLHHGSETGWTAPRRTEELFPLPAGGAESWSALLPRFEYLVDDLTAEREEALQARPGLPLVPLTLLLLRSGRSEKLVVLLEGWRPLLARLLAAPDARDQVSAILNYLLKVGAEEAHEPLRRVLDSIAGEQTEELMKTMGDAYMEKGHAVGLEEGLAKGRVLGVAEGRAEGRAKERAEAVLRILSLRGIPVDETASKFILACTDLEILERWFERALRATRVMDLLA